MGMRAVKMMLVLIVLLQSLSLLADSQDNRRWDRLYAEVLFGYNANRICA